MIIEAILRAYLTDTLRHVQAVGTIAARRIVMQGNQPDVYAAGWSDAVQAMATALELAGEMPTLQAAPAALSAPAITLLTRRLTKRQRQIAPMVAAGLQNGEIAERIRIDVDTVRTHRAALFKRLGVHNIDELAIALQRLPAV